MLALVFSTSTSIIYVYIYIYIYNPLNKPVQTFLCPPNLVSPTEKNNPNPTQTYVPRKSTALKLIIQINSNPASLKSNGYCYLDLPLRPPTPAWFVTVLCVARTPEHRAHPRPPPTVSIDLKIQKLPPFPTPTSLDTHRCLPSSRPHASPTHPMPVHRHKITPPTQPFRALPSDKRLLAAFLGPGGDEIAHWCGVTSTK